MMTSAAEYGSRAQVATKLGVSLDTIDRRLTDGTLTRHRLGSRVLISWAEVDNLLHPRPAPRSRRAT